MTCPYLGSRTDQTQHHPYPTEENSCYARRVKDTDQPTEIGAGHQQRYCLSDAFSRCPIFAAVASSAERQSDDDLLSAEALYEKGMAHYRRREWIEARECFRRLNELEPNRKAINDLLDDLNLFIQLQSMRTTAGEGGDGEEGDASTADLRIGERSREIDEESSAGETPAPVARKRSGWLVALSIVLLLGIAATAVLLTVDLSALQSSQETDQYLKNLYNRGQALLAVEDYDGAIAAFQELLSMAPDDREAQVGLERAKRLRTLDQLYREAKQLIADEDWNVAAERLKSIIELDPSYKDAHDLSSTVERQRRLIALYEQGKTNYELGNWAASTADFEQLRSLDASFRSDVVQEYLFQSYLNDGLALIEGAGEAVDPIKTAIQRFASSLGIHPRDKRAIEERRLANLYLDGRLAYGKKDWSETITKVRDVYSARSEYAGGWAARTLYSAYVQQGDEYLAAGNCQMALDMYRLGQTIGVTDRSLAEQRVTEAQQCISPPTATMTATPTSSPTPPATDTPRVTATPVPNTPTPRPTSTQSPPTQPPPTERPADPPTERPTDPPTDPPPTSPPPPPTATPPR
jgi:outer membrane protein assembly factor BamD (BamD/ComL family)